MYLNLHAHIVDHVGKRNHQVAKLRVQDMANDSGFTPIPGATVVTDFDASTLGEANHILCTTEGPCDRKQTEAARIENREVYYCLSIEMVEDASEGFSKVGMFEARMVVGDDFNLTYTDHPDDLVIVDLEAIDVIRVLGRFFLHETRINDQLQEFFKISEHCPMTDGQTSKLAERFHVFLDFSCSNFTEIV